MTREQKRLERKTRKAKIRAAQYAAASARKQTKHKTVAKRPLKINGYKNAKLHARNNRKQTEAVERQNNHNKLSIAERIEKAVSRRGNSVREVARLTAKQISAQKN